MPDYPPMPDYPFTHEYPPTPDYPPGPGYRTAAGYPPGYPATEYRPAGYPTTGYPADRYAAAEYPAPAHPADGYAAAEYPAPAHPAEVYPAAGHQHGGPVSPVAEVQTADGRWVLESAPVSHEEYVHRGGMPAQAGPVDAGRWETAPVDAAPATGPGDAQWSMLAYLTVPFFGFLVPLAVYLLAMRGSRWVRDHAAQAINVWLTVFLYELSAVIIGAMLVFDSRQVALTVVVTLIAVLWLTALSFLVRAATAAGRGETYTFPRWLCTRMVR